MRRIFWLCLAATLLVAGCDSLTSTTTANDLATFAGDFLRQAAAAWLL